MVQSQSDMKNNNILIKIRKNKIKYKTEMSEFQQMFLFAKSTQSLYNMYWKEGGIISLKRLN
jgi:hypothetical protein